MYELKNSFHTIPDFLFGFLSVLRERKEYARVALRKPQSVMKKRQSVISSFCIKGVLPIKGIIKILQGGNQNADGCMVCNSNRYCSDWIFWWNLVRAQIAGRVENGCRRIYYHRAGICLTGGLLYLFSGSK